MSESIWRAVLLGMKFKTGNKTTFDLLCQYFDSFVVPQILDMSSFHSNLKYLGFNKNMNDNLSLTLHTVS